MGQPGYILGYGTSEGAPAFAAIAAIADQAAGHRLGLLNPALYRLGGRRDAGIVDVTSGNNSVRFKQNGRMYRVRGWDAGSGYDLASGLGTVDAAKLVAALVLQSR